MSSDVLAGFCSGEQGRISSSARDPHTAAHLAFFLLSLPVKPAEMTVGSQPPALPPLPDSACGFEQAQITRDLQIILPPCCPVKSTNIPTFPIAFSLPRLLKDLGTRHCWWDFKTQPRQECQVLAKQLLCTVKATHCNDLYSPLLNQLQPFV